MTNVATAVDRDPGFAGRLRSLTIMGDDYSAGGRQAEHSFASDLVAARTVLASGASTVVTGLDATTRVRLGPGRWTRSVGAVRRARALAAEVAAF